MLRMKRKVRKDEQAVIASKGPSALGVEKRHDNRLITSVRDEGTAH